MDDISVLIATTKTNLQLHNFIYNLIENETYDKDHKNLIIKPQPGNVFLDTTIVIFNNNQSVKIIYNNKNHDCIYNHYQTVGRFHHAHAPCTLR